ncbi:MAG: response regulator [Candidatus Omnitrophota bacterium]|jgi:DNA-binding response OmpR family regulator
MVQTPRTILIIDDEREICEFLKLRLESFGFSASYVTDGEAGLKKAIEALPDCVLLDIRLKVGDGLTVLRSLRAYRHEDSAIQDRVRKIPVIILTAAGGAMCSLFRLEGANDYMEKPFDAEHLKARILKVLEG